MTDALSRLSAALADRYRIEREIGQGGMATVYFAHDLRHDRRVALKVLRPEIAAVIGAERFLREITTTANLQHPHILPLFDSGKVEGTAFYVMPFVQGESLRARLSREKQLPIDDSVRITREVAGALDYAHRHGVIHRDIKPENILLHDGQALVADFGIALAVQSAGGQRMTQTGLSLGTPQYMSPEQAMGERDLDARTDVYALGCVLYEMLTGEPPFSGPTAQAIAAKVMTDEPRAPATLRKTIPPQVDAATLTALAKLPADRWESAARFAEALRAESASRYVGTSGRRTATDRLASRPALLVAGAAAIALAGLLAGWLVSRRNDPVLPQPSRLAVFTPTESIVGSALQRVIDISPDGELLAYSANSASGEGIRLRRLDGTTSIPLAGGEFSRNLRFSPDGRFLYSPHASQTMQRISVGGGAWTPVPQVPPTPYLAWDSDGALWWSPVIGRGLHRIPAGGGPDEFRFPPDSTGQGHTIQQVLPGDRKALVIFRPSAVGNTGQAAFFDLGTGAHTVLFDSPVIEVRYTDGFLVYVRPDNSMHAVAFDPGSGRVTGEPVQIADDVFLSGAGIAQFAVSAKGVVVHVPTMLAELVLVDRDGSARPLTGLHQNYHNPRFSPDGRRVVVDYAGREGRDVWVLDRDQGQLTRVTFDKDGHDPIWTPDGMAIWYVSFRTGKFGLYRVRPGGDGRSDSVLVHPSLAYPGVWLPDGKTLVTTALDLNGRSGNDIALIHLEEPIRIEPLIATSFVEGWVAPSRDGKWLAFVSDQSGRQEVYLRSLGPRGTQIQVTVDGGTEPVWSRIGRELFYRRPAVAQVELVAAELELGPEPRVLRRTVLFDASSYDAAAPHPNYDIAPDGKSFVMLRRGPSSHIMVTQNLPELMRRNRRTAPR